MSGVAPTPVAGLHGVGLARSDCALLRDIEKSSAIGRSEPLLLPVTKTRPPLLLSLAGRSNSVFGFDLVEDESEPSEVLSQRDPLRLGQALLAQEVLSFGRGPRPGGPMARGDAGVGTAGRLAEGGERSLGLRCCDPLKAQRRRRIEEAVGKNADMERARKARRSFSFETRARG